MRVSPAGSQATVCGNWPDHDLRLCTFSNLKLPSGGSDLNATAPTLPITEMAGSTVLVICN